MPHAFATHFGAGDFDPAFITDDAFITDPFILSAMAFPVLGRTENPFTKETVFFRLQRPIVNRFRFGDLTMRPGTNLFGRSQSDLHRIKFVHI